MAKRSFFPVSLDSWDSRFFKVPVARLIISGKKRYRLFFDEIKDLLRRAKEEKVKFLFIRLEDPASFHEQILLKARLKDCGEYVNLVFRRSTPLSAHPVDGYKIRPFEKKDLDQICEIAKNSFQLSYFYRSGFAKKEKIGLYHKVWLKNQTFNKNYLVFVTEKNGRIAGFVTINLKNYRKSARMSLMAVHKRHRGKGLGDFMIRSMLLEACRRKKDTHFRTQSDNRFAVPIYKKIGCRVVNYEKIFFKKI
jgi:ribosomal protein S18 acetylase RimI-like enzyme